MNYVVDTAFEPRFELLSSLHTMICRKSHKKIDISSKWVKDTLNQLTLEFANLLGEAEIDSDWKTTYLLNYVCPGELSPEGFLAWLEAQSPGDLYEQIAAYSQQFPKDMGEFRSRTLKLLSGWNEQYFRRLDPTVLSALLEEVEQRKKEQSSMKTDQFVDRTTNGLAFRPKEGLERLVLIPQYHFQPMNVIYHFGQVTLCHYSARIYLGDDKNFPPQEYRMIRALGEQSRLKILRYLSEGPRTFTEIVRHLKLSKGITHDHVSKLRSGGFIRAHFEGETVAEYSLRPEMLSEMHGKLMDFILTK